MKERYRELDSYVDRGRLTRTSHGTNITYVDVSFRTFFKRPSNYRFEWLADIRPYHESYWSNPLGVFVKAGNDAPYRLSTLNALFKPVEIAAARQVLQFLAPDEVAEAPDFFHFIERLEDDIADGVPCYRLRGRTSVRGHHRELWIGRDDFLLRKVLTLTPYNYNVSRKPTYLSGGETVCVYYNDVTVDLNLPDELFYPFSRR